MDTDNLKTLKFLYVEDDSSTKEEIVRFFQRRNLNIITAANGREGLTIYHEQKPDVVLSDIRMPEMDGLQMIEAIKDDNPDIPAVITTAYSDYSYLLEAIEIGVNGYVLKPIDLQKLLKIIEKCSTSVINRRMVERYQEEREKRIIDLQEALENIKVLEGLLPICTVCKKIRDDQGHWKKFEAYIVKHSEAQFSQGICPECMKRSSHEYADG